MGHAEAQREKETTTRALEQDHKGRVERERWARESSGSPPSLLRHRYVLLTLTENSDSPPGGRPRLDDLPLAVCHAEITCWHSNQCTLAQVCKCRFCPHLSELAVLSFAPSSWKESVIQAIQKCPIIIDLSVLIFINNWACDDPAGMLMSPQLELISCRRRSGRLSIPPWSSARLSNVHSCAVHFVMRPVDDKTLHQMTSLFSSTPGVHKRKVLPQQNLLFFSQRLCPLAPLLLTRCTIPSLN